MRKRREKLDHLVYADAVDSRGKSGVWFGERTEFQARQQDVMEKIKDEADWLPLEGAIMCVSVEPAGIAVIVPNPSLPGIMVLADGSTQEVTAQLQARYTKLVAEAVKKLEIELEFEPGSETSS
jgi:hypothetical protein